MFGLERTRDDDRMARVHAARRGLASTGEWIEIGSPEGPAWVGGAEPWEGLIDGFAPAPPAICRDAVGFVHLRGQVAHSSGAFPTARTHLFSLPPDFYEGGTEESLVAIDLQSQTQVGVLFVNPSQFGGQVFFDIERDFDLPLPTVTRLSLDGAFARPRGPTS